MTGFPEVWDARPLSEILVANIGGVWGKAEGESEVDVRVIRVTEMRPGGNLDQSTAARRSITLKQLQSRVLHPGDLLLEKSGGGPKTPVGRVALVTSTPEKSVCANFMQLMRPDPNIVDSRYLHLYLTHLHDRGGTIGFQTATTNIRNIKMSEYMASVVPLPPLGEQRGIVAVLEDHLSRLERARESVKWLRSRAELLNASAAVRLRQDALRGNEPLGTIGDLATLDSGPAFKSALFRGDGEGIRLLRGDNIDVGALRWDRTKTWPVELLRGYEHLQVQAGDVILAMDRPIISAGLKLARVTDRDVPALLVQRVARIRPVSPDGADYLYALLDSPHFVAYLKAKSVGTQLPHVTLKAIRDYPVPLVDGEKQRQLLACLQDARIESARLHGALTTTVTKSAELRQSLLRAAFSGQLTRGSISV